jgi:hypothetical protein
VRFFFEPLRDPVSRHIPCLSTDGEHGARMEGMVTIGDVVKALLSEEREEVQICKDYIAGMYD